MTRIARVMIVFSVLVLVCFGADAGLNPQDLLKSLSSDWPTFNGDYSGKRYSSLSQINQNNVQRLTLAWVLLPQSVGIKSTPLEVNGILYFTTPDNVWAADARTGQIIWHYYRESTGDHIGHRGVGMYKDRLYFETPDCHLICLNAKNGSVIWNIELADPKLGYFATMAPLIVRDHVIAGVSGDVTDVPGFLEAIDPETGKVQWRWNSEPGAARAWIGDLAARHGCDQPRRWDDLADGYVRSRVKPALLGYRESESGSEWGCAQGRESLHLLDRFAQPRHG